MVLKELDFLNRNNKIIIIGAMIIGVLYPFFTDLDIPINPKYILIGASIIGMVLFWEIYGEKKYPEKAADYSDMQSQKQRQGYRQPYLPQPQPPQQNYPHPYPIQNYPPQYQPYPPNPGYAPSEQEQFQGMGYPQPQQQPVRNHPPQYQQYRPKPRQSSVEMLQEYDEEYQTEEPNQRLPKLSDVIEGKAKLPDIIPAPRNTPVKSKGQSSFKKFGLER